MTCLCVSIMVDDVASALEIAAQAKARGADLVEWRVDRIGDDIDAVEQLVAASPMPCIVTCRHSDEGGQCQADEQQRITLLEHVALHARPRFLDVELATLERSANIRRKIGLAVKHPDQLRELDTSLIVSTHDFKSRPTDLFRRLERMADDDLAAVVKIAWTARSVRENLDAFEIIRSMPKPTIALCMGPHGLMSRVLAPKFDALLTFASAPDTPATAPGQPTIDDLVNTYRFKAIDSHTKVFGIIGHPVAHSRSPALHNAGFADVNFNGVYLPLDVAPDRLAFDTTLEALLEDQSLDFAGCSVTIPHKQHLLHFVEKRNGLIGPEARAACAANTLMVRDDATLEAQNSDLPGIVHAIADKLGLDPDGPWPGLRAAIIGAGGMAHAAAAGLAMRGAHVTIHNRTHDRAQAMIENIARAMTQSKTSFGPLRVAAPEQIKTQPFDIIINATPIGMTGGPDPAGNPVAFDPRQLDDLAWPQSALVVDTVYTPRITPFLAWAARCRFETIDGLDLFIRQAQAQFRWWTGRTLRPELCRAMLD